MPRGTINRFSVSTDGLRLPHSKSLIWLGEMPVSFAILYTDIPLDFLISLMRS